MVLLVVIAFLWNIPEYSIFQKMENFACCSIFLEYSRNIPYSRKTQHYHVEQIFWNIPFREISYSVDYSMNIPWNIPKNFWTLFYGGAKFNQVPYPVRSHAFIQGLPGPGAGPGIFFSPRPRRGQGPGKNFWPRVIFLAPAPAGPWPRQIFLGPGCGFGPGPGGAIAPAIMKSWLPTKNKKLPS